MFDSYVYEFRSNPTRSDYHVGVASFITFQTCACPNIYLRRDSVCIEFEYCPHNREAFFYKIQVTVIALRSKTCF